MCGLASIKSDTVCKVRGHSALILPAATNLTSSYIGRYLVQVVGLIAVTIRQRVTVAQKFAEYLGDLGMIDRLSAFVDQ